MFVRLEFFMESSEFRITSLDLYCEDAGFLRIVVGWRCLGYGHEEREMQFV